MRDSFVGMALVLDAMAARELPVSALADELPRYAIHKTKIDARRGKDPGGLRRTWNSTFPMRQADRLDGLRLDWHDRDGSGSWLLVRASNTEPIVRIIAEAPTPDEAHSDCATKRPL